MIYTSIINLNCKYQNYTDDSQYYNQEGITQEESIATEVPSTDSPIKYHTSRSIRNIIQKKMYLLINFQSLE